MKKIIIATVLFFAIGATAMAQSGEAKAPAKQEKTQKKHGKKHGKKHHHHKHHHVKK